MDIFGVAKTIVGLIFSVPQTVAKVIPSGYTRDRVAEASTWQGAGVIGALVFILPDLNLHQQWAAIIILGLVGIAQILKRECDAK